MVNSCVRNRSNFTAFVCIKSPFFGRNIGKTFFLFCFVSGDTSRTREMWEKHGKTG